ncbi:alkaline phosphatase family protein [Geminicoccus roseus]|uniref:sulfatase-like hydrolase/transferase n=1 Tax=Geminicoccus roseus TaxID=404900 RepID=UPI0003FC1613|nr:sulfatase-like hydrolase/transferase [Geminicoccus roseus]
MMILCHLASAATLAFALFLLPALAVQAPNAQAFAASSWSVLLPFAGLFLLAFLLLGGIGLVSRWSRRLLVAYLVVAVMALLCGQIFGQTEGVVLDGAAHDLDVPALRAGLELAALAVVALAGALAWRRIASHAGTTVLVVAGWALASGLVSASSHGGGADQGEAEAALDLGALSSRFNVIHVMFDSLRSDVLAEILEGNPELAAGLQGFTIYPEHAGYSNWTTISLGAILADRLYFEEPVGDEPANDLFGRWIGRESLPARLQADGFQVAAMPPGRIFCETASFPCAVLDVAAAGAGVEVDQSDPGATLQAERILLANLALLRLAPAFLKPAVYDRGGFLIPDQEAGASLTPIQRDIVLSRDMVRHVARSLAVRTEQPVYKFLHFYPPHRPFMLDAACARQEEVLESWENYRAQATCAVRLFADLVTRLKELDAFDHSLIVLQSDTGLNTRRSGKGGGQPVTTTESYDQAELLGYARPALAIKPIGGTSALAVSAERTHHRDTFRLLAEASRGSDGRMQLDLEPRLYPADGPRPFVVSGPVRPHTRRLAPYDRFAVDGPVADWASWRFEGSFEAPGTPLRAPEPIRAVRLSAPGSDRVAPGQEIQLTALVEGGSDQVVLTFLRRTADGRLDVIAPWGFARSINWVVEDGNRDACRLELLAVARNELDPEDKRRLGELSIPLSRPGC